MPVMQKIAYIFFYQFVDTRLTTKTLSWQMIVDNDYILGRMETFGISSTYIITVHILKHYQVYLISVYIFILFDNLSSMYHIRTDVQVGDTLKIQKKLIPIEKQFKWYET